jgi:anaerobic selenocysteine-containing dehydrogenase
VAKKVGGPVGAAFPWRRFEDALKARLEGLAEAGGLTGWDGGTPPWKTFKEGRPVSPDHDSPDALWKKLGSGGFWYLPTHEFLNWDNCFRTPSGKFEFASGRLEQAVKEAAAGAGPEAVLTGAGVEAGGDESYMPHYEKALSGQPGPGELVLVPYEMFNHSTGWLPSPPFLTKTLFDNQLRKEELFAEMNPETAAGLRLGEGDRVLLQSDAGEAVVRVHVFEGAMPGHVYLPLGFGHTAYGVYQKDKGVNAARLVAGEKDPLTGRTVWWTTSVRVKKT